MVNISLIICIVLFFIIDKVMSINNPVDFVNLLAGSFTDGNRFSTGNTLPLVGRPWGFNHWSPQSKDGSKRTGSWWFQGSEHRFTWLRCTHQPSPWIGDWGSFLFGPQVGEKIDRNPQFFWEPRAAILKPHLFDATVAPLGIRMELAPTDHGAVLRVTFPKRGIGNKRVCFAQAEWLKHGATPIPWITGRSTEVHQDRMLVSNFAMHIRVISEDAASAEGIGDVTCFKFKADAHIVTVRIASSLISDEQAEVNLNREVGIQRSFDEIAAEAKDVWNKMLSRVDVVDPGELTGTVSRHLSIFYTSLWRSLTFPRRIDEITKDGNMVHYSPYDPRGGVHDGPLVTDNGFWDTFRTVYPMLSLLYPDHLGIIIQGWLNAYKEGGWLPSWASPGYRNCMVGTYADVVVADAIVKNIKGFEHDTALAAMRKDSFTGPPPLSGGAVGKECLNEYVDRGYISSDNPHGGETVSRTLDFGFADFAVAKGMKRLQELSSDENVKKSLQSDIERLEKRADRAVHSLYNADHGLMAPKASSGGFSLRFEEKAWGNGFTEGNSWHHSFPPYALNKLASMHGSKEKLLLKLHAMLEIPSDFQVGSYGQEIHEMTEMRALAMGQYGHNNQPCHHILYLFAMLGDREATERNVRAIIDRAYGVDFYAGDEDNGEQGAWFVLSALGLYSIVPGTPDYVLGSPIFKHVRIWRSGDDKDITKNEYLDIVALGTSDKNILVSEVQLNGNSVNLPTVQDGDLQKTAILRFIMENEKLSDGSIPEFNKYQKNNHDKEMDYIKHNKEQQDLIDELKAELLKLKTSNNKNNIINKIDPTTKSIRDINNIDIIDNTTNTTSSSNTKVFLFALVGLFVLLFLIVLGKSVAPIIQGGKSQAYTV